MTDVQKRRLMALILEGKSGADIAKAEGVTRQSVCESLRDPEAQAVIGFIRSCRQRFAERIIQRYPLCCGAEHKQNWDRYRALMRAWDQKRTPQILRRLGMPGPNTHR